LVPALLWSAQGGKPALFIEIGPALLLAHGMVVPVANDSANETRYQMVSAVAALEANAKTVDHSRLPGHVAVDYVRFYRREGQ
jgi:hypothetical protein